MHLSHESLRGIGTGAGRAAVEATIKELTPAPMPIRRVCAKIASGIAGRIGSRHPLVLAAAVVAAGMLLVARRADGSAPAQRWQHP